LGGNAGARFQGLGFSKNKQYTRLDDRNVPFLNIIYIL